MPNILQTLLPTFGGKTVFVTDQAGNEVFPRAQILKAEIKPESMPMEHPIETGAIITDHRILKPIEIELSIILSRNDYRDVYKQIITLYQRGTLLIVQSRGGAYENQVIQAPPHTEDSEQQNSIVLSLKLKQVLIAATPGTTNSVSTSPAHAAARVTTPQSPTNANNVNVGTQNATEDLANRRRLNDEFGDNS
jgi:hypothetical protein